MTDETEVWLVRHGETEWSRDGRHTSTTDLPLTERGEEQARTLRDRLSGAALDRVVSSPLQRARRTAELAGVEVDEVDDDLHEWRYGDYEGISTPRIRESVPGWTVWKHPVFGGESGAEVAARCDRVIGRCRAHGGRTLLVAHGHLLRVLAARWVVEAYDFGRHLHLDTATVSVLGDDRDAPVIVRWNG
ncbi:MAG: histidine phosphatase family protein [Nocardioidaceae bacterium]|jgi:probable phosphoglycerate mutase|nr:histidine phosphatase family protein [Nocardioidaceae bacterium]